MSILKLIVFMLKIIINNHRLMLISIFQECFRKSQKNNFKFFESRLKVLKSKKIIQTRYFQFKNFVFKCIKTLNKGKNAAYTFKKNPKQSFPISIRYKNFKNHTRLKFIFAQRFSFYNVWLKEIKRLES